MGELVELRRGDGSEEDRQLAFELWLGPGGRNLKRTLALLAEEPYLIEVPYRTIWSWERTLKWHDRADQLQRQLSPALHGRFVNMAEAAAVNWMGRILSASEGVGTVTSQEVAAAKLAFEATGWLRDVAKGAQVTVQVANVGSNPLVGLSDAERKRHLAAIMGGEGLDKPEE